MINILVVDDMKTIHSWVGGLLIKSPEIIMHSAFHGQELLNYLSNHEPPHLILLDWEMPVLDGVQTLMALQQRNICIPVVMMTTKSAPEEIQQMLEFGAAEYLIKPFTADILFERISRVLGKDVTYAA